MESGSREGETGLGLKASPGAPAAGYPMPRGTDAPPEPGPDADPAPGCAVRLTRFDGLDAEERTDLLAEEEPLELRVAGKPMAVILRTPGHDRELLAGFLFAEGLIDGVKDLRRLAPCLDGPDSDLENAWSAALAREPAEPGVSRQFAAASSCGLCGRATLEALRAAASPLEDGLVIPLERVYAFEPRMRAAQRSFQCTGGLHAAGLFSGEGELLVVREDIGRHSAVDKVIGHALLRGWLPLDRHVLVVSGRVSFEILQKALRARVPIVAAVSAPSSFAVAFAREFNLTLLGFVRGRRANLYAGEQRIVPGDGRPVPEGSRGA